MTSTDIVQVYWWTSAMSFSWIHFGILCVVLWFSLICVHLEIYAYVKVNDEYLYHYVPFI